MKKVTDRSTASPLFDATAYDLIEDRLRANVRATIEALLEEELNEEFRRRIKIQTVLPCARARADAVSRALLASVRIQMRKVDGWETPSQPLEPMPLDLAA